MLYNDEIILPSKMIKFTIFNIHAEIVKYLKLLLQLENTLCPFLLSILNCESSGCENILWFLQACDRCDQNIPNKWHPAENAIDGSTRWWQSPPLSRGSKYNEVNLTIDLGQVSFTHFFSKFQLVWVLSALERLKIIYEWRESCVSAIA